MTERNAGAGIIAALRTPVATLAVLVAALLAQLPHAADVFRLVVHGSGWWQIAHSYSYAIALELAVLLFVVQRRNVESYLFAFVSICVNLAYYSLHGVNLFSVEALPAWLISIALPAAIARYSHLIVDADQHATGPQTWRWRFWRKSENNASIAPAFSTDSNTPVDMLTAQIDGATPANGQSAQPRKRTAKRRKAAKLTPEQRRAQVMESGMTDAATIAAQFNVSMRTAQADIAATRDAMLQTNGA